MGLPNSDDLKAFEAPRFYLFSEDEAGYILAACLALALVADRLGFLA